MKVADFTEIKKAMAACSVEDAVAVVAEAFASYSAGEVVVAPVQHLGPLRGKGDVCVKSGFVKGGSSLVVKIAGGGFGTGSQGAVLVQSQDTGEIEAVLCDRAYLTDVRTAAAGALCCRLCVPKTGEGKKGFGNGVVGIIGSGVQARSVQCPCLHLFLSGNHTTLTFVAQVPSQVCGGDARVDLSARGCTQRRQASCMRRRTRRRSGPGWRQGRRG